MKYLYILLIFTHLICTCTLSLLPFREHDNSVRVSHDFDDPTQQNDFDEDHLGQDCSKDCNCLTCNNTLPRPKKVINPYKEKFESSVPPKPFGSFCVKCAACLAVAKEIQNVIENTSQECETDLQKKAALLQEIETKIIDLCENGFRNFDLRSYKQHEVLTNNFQCTTHVTSTMDGNWTKKLRELCTMYISRINMEMVTIKVLDSLGNLTDTFCRGTGVFRDCANIQSHQNLTVPKCKDCDC